jgi:hypothetical protein
VIRKITDLVYEVQIDQRHVNLNVEQLKLCRASREELRERKKQNKQRMREQRARPEISDSYSDSDSSAISEERDPYLFVFPQDRRTNRTNLESSESVVTQRDTESESAEGGSASGAEISGIRPVEVGQERYSLRPRVGRNYKE